MGNSNTTLQDVVDGVSTIGDLTPVMVNTGGYADQPAITIANDVLSEMIAERFPWKWNRMKFPPFILFPRQQDYVSIRVLNLGWLENGFRVDINSTQFPPYSERIFVVRDIAVSTRYAGWPEEACWFPNDQLEHGVWPGPLVVYTNPIGEAQTPDNPSTNIRDKNDNILVLTTFGITGLTPPVAVYPPIDSTDPTTDTDFEADLTGQVIVDGTCEWTVVNPSAAGIRVAPPPGNGGTTWLIRLFAQKKAPVITKLTQKLNPIPDDQIKWFRDGFVAYAHRHSANPVVRARYPQMKQEWINSMGQAARQGDREDESKGFFPAHSLLEPGYFQDLGPGNPYMRRGGRR